MTTYTLHCVRFGPRLFGSDYLKMRGATRRSPCCRVADEENRLCAGTPDRRSQRRGATRWVALHAASARTCGGAGGQRRCAPATAGRAPPDTQSAIVATYCPILAPRTTGREFIDFRKLSYFSFNNEQVGEQNLSCWKKLASGGDARDPRH